MKLSTKGRYGLKAMYDLAVNRGAPVAIKTIAQRQGISEAYLEQLVASLRKAGLVESLRGAQGGYTLAREPRNISIGEILTALEGKLSVTDCVGDAGCGNVCSCPSRGVFQRIQKSIDSVVNTMTLEDMVNDAAGGCEEE
jgi:Rrf2 family cysteine metabolism transcriptional repressor